MPIGNHIEAEQALRGLLDGLRRQVAAAVDQSQRLRTDVAEAHTASTSLHASAAQVPDVALIQQQIDAGLARAQSRLNEMAEAAIQRTGEQLRYAKQDLGAVVQDGVSALERCSEHARRAVGGISRTIDQKLNAAAQRAEEIVALLAARSAEAARSIETARQAPIAAAAPAVEAKRSVASDPVSFDERLAAVTAANEPFRGTVAEFRGVSGAPMVAVRLGHRAFGPPMVQRWRSGLQTRPVLPVPRLCITMPPAMWAAAVPRQLPETHVPEAITTANLAEVEKQLSQRVQQMMAQAVPAGERPRNVETPGAMAA